MTPRDRQAIEAMREFASRALRLHADRPSGDEATAYALRYCLLALGEAAKRVSAEQRRAASAVPWREAAGLRDHLAYGYEHVNDTLVLATVTDDIPGLLAALDALLAGDR